VLGERVERNLDGVRETLIVAAYTKNRRRLLEDAKLAPELLRATRATRWRRQSVRCPFRSEQRLGVAATEDELHVHTSGSSTTWSG
jgi:hypothetical protein